MSELGFSQMMLYELKKRDPRASALQSRAVKGGAEIGLEQNGEFKAVLRVAGASKSYNVMSLLWKQSQGWAPTMVRGTPAQIAERLAGTLHHLWSNALPPQNEAK